MTDRGILLGDFIASKKMLESRPEDGLVKLVKTVETAYTGHTALVDCPTR